MVKKYYNKQKKIKKKKKSELNGIATGNPKHKIEKQSYTIKNIRNIYDSRKKFINLLNDNAKIRSEAIQKSKQNETKVKGLKILTPKQMLQILPIALAQVKAGNNSENLNESGKLFILCIKPNKSLKKYTIA